MVLPTSRTWVCSAEVCLQTVAVCVHAHACVCVCVCVCVCEALCHYFLVSTLDWKYDKWTLGAASCPSQKSAKSVRHHTKVLTDGEGKLG